MLVTGPGRHPPVAVRHAAAGTPPGALSKGYGTRATPITTTASIQRRSHGEERAFPRRMRPENAAEDRRPTRPAAR
jgi:hypothetical protein